MRFAKLLVFVSSLSFSNASFAQDTIKALQRLRTIAEVGSNNPDHIKELKRVLKAADRYTKGIQSGLQGTSGHFSRNFIFQVSGSVIEDLGGRPLSLTDLKKNAEYGRLLPQDIEDLRTILEALQREDFADLIAGLKGLSGRPAQTYVIKAAAEVVKVLGGDVRGISAPLPECLTSLLR